MTNDSSSERALPEASERVARATRFYEELSDISEVFSDIVEAYGARTLADLFHLHAAIMNNGFIDIWPDSEVPKILAQLPSADRWLEYANVYGENGLEKRSIFSNAPDVAVPFKSAPDNADDGLTPEQQEALDAFRTRNGRNWKSALRMNWWRARYPSMAPDHAAALQQIRNTLGPEWLAKYRPQGLPKSESPDRLEAIKEALQRDGEDPKFLDKVLGTLRAQNVSSLDDQEIDRAFGAVMLAHHCTRYVKAARNHGLTVDDVYLGTTLPRDPSEPKARESLIARDFYGLNSEHREVGSYSKERFGDLAGGEEGAGIITDHDGNELKSGSDSPEP